MIIAPSFTPRGANADEKKLLALLLLDDDDYTRAERRFERHVPPAYRGIITGDGWTYDPGAGHYVRRNGRVLDDQDLKSIMLLFVLSEEHELEDAAESMVRGDVTVEQWQLNAAQIVKDTYTASALVAAGGADRIEPADVTAIIGKPETDETPGTGLTDALERLDEFGKQVISHDAGDSPVVIRRAGLYAKPANHTFEVIYQVAQGRRKGLDGNTLVLQERNILEPGAEHCTNSEFTDGCWELTNAGWVEYGSMSLPGERTCKYGCKCHMQYRVKPPKDEPTPDQP